jgi:hypothetical protein
VRDDVLRPEYRFDEWRPVVRAVTRINVSSIVDGRLVTTTHELRDEGETHVVSLPWKTLRDEFAMAALTGLLANPDNGYTVFDGVVDDAYICADLMLRAREARA